MSVSVLDPKSALLVIDLQKGIAAMAAALGAAPAVARVVAQARLLAQAFRRRGLPVVLVNVAGQPPGRTEQGARLTGLPPDWTELLPELDRQPGDHVVTKRTWGAFAGTGLAQHLAGQGVSQIVIAGVATSVGVESTAREAYALGFNVTLALDAVADMNAEAHANSVERIFPRLGETGATNEIVALLEGGRR